MSKNDDFQFETAFARLELILDKMNSGKSSLDESIKLYEEADKLIAICSKQLTSVETRIETLIKKRDGSVTTEPLEPQVQEV